MDKQTGYLTIFGAGREIYGEFADADWSVEDTPGGRNNVFSAMAGDGTIDTFQRINREGISHVRYTFDSEGARYSGSAELLRPETDHGQSLIKIESGQPPLRE